MNIHELTVDGLVTAGIGDVVNYDADCPLSIGVDSMAIMSGPLSWLRTTRVLLDPIQESVQVVVGTDAGAVVVGLFRGDGDRWYANVAIDGIDGQQVHLAELGARRNTPLVSIPNRGYCFDSSSFVDDPNGDATLVQQYTVMISDEGAWHRTVWTHLAEAVAWLCRDLGLVVGASEL